MRTLRILALAALTLTGCLALKPDGRAIECSACEAIWLKLEPEAGFPGVYRVIHGSRRKPCRTCERRATAFLDGAPALTHCPDCGGELAYRPVIIRGVRASL